MSDTFLELRDWLFAALNNPYVNAPLSFIGLVALVMSIVDGVMRLFIPSRRSVTHGDYLRMVRAGTEEVRMKHGDRYADMFQDFFRHSVAPALDAVSDSDLLLIERALLHDDFDGAIAILEGAAVDLLRSERPAKVEQICAAVGTLRLLSRLVAGAR